MRVATVLSTLWLTGCFYVDPVNQRPSLDIDQKSADPVYRNDLVSLEAVASDPEKQIVSFQWRVYSCTDATMLDTCDPEPWFTEIRQQAEFRVPAYRVDPDGAGPLLGPPVESLWVVLEGKDELGATAKPRQTLKITVLNAAPTLDLRKVAAHGAVIGTDVDLYARYGDPDDMPETVTLEWTAFSPRQVPDTLEEIRDTPDPDPRFRNALMRLTPSVIGEWDIRVVAIDRLGARTEKHLPLNVVEDQPPCLGQWSPLAPSGGAQLPVAEPTLFQVLLVDDDLDPYPGGDATFQWSIKPPGATQRQPLATTSNSVAFDPASYTPGDVIELRVEIFDRNANPVTCPEAAQTCAIIPTQPTCLQRQTWRVEAR